MDNNIIISIQLISEIGKPNVNGITFDKNSYIKAMNSEYTKEAIKHGGMPLFIEEPKNNVIPFENKIGEVISFDTESITVKMTPNMYNTYLGNRELDYYRAGLYVVGKMKDDYNMVFGIEKILGFQLLNRKAIAIRRIV